jgi:hypothetical protein
LSRAALLPSIGSEDTALTEPYPRISLAKEQAKREKRKITKLLSCLPLFA